MSEDKFDKTLEIIKLVDERNRNKFIASIVQQTLQYVAENAEIRYVFDEPVVYKKGILNIAPDIINIINKH